MGSSVENLIAKFLSTTSGLFKIGTIADGEFLKRSGNNIIGGPAGAGLTYNEVTGTSETLVANNAYTSNNAGLVTLTLPATATIGDIIEIGGKGAGGWRVAQLAGQTIHFGTLDTTTGTGGRLDSTNTFDVIRIRCTTANTDWRVESSQGNITVT